MLVVDLDRLAAFHLATALDVHRKVCVANGVGLPSELAQLAQAAWDRAKGDSECQEGTSLDEMSEFAHSPVIEPQLLTVPEAARALRLSERQVKRLVAAGALPSVLIDSARRIRAEDLTTYVRSLNQGSFRSRVEVKTESPGASE